MRWIVDIPGVYVDALGAGLELADSLKACARYRPHPGMGFLSAIADTSDPPVPGLGGGAVWINDRW